MTERHHKPELIFLGRFALLEEDAMKLGQIGMIRQVTEHHKLFFDLLEIVGDRFEYFNSNFLPCGLIMGAVDCEITPEKI